MPLTFASSLWVICVAGAVASQAAFAATPAPSPTPPPTKGALEPLRLHPQNPHYFLFRGKPALLITSGEHYGAVMNLDFDYVPYLDELKAKGLNLTRLFSGAYCEEWGKPFNTLRPEPNRFLTPWARSATPGFAVGGNKFDLSKWDPVYFARLKDFVAQAGKRGVVVEYVFFCVYYADAQWNISPFKVSNNVNGVGTCSREAATSLGCGNLLAVQDAFVTKVLQELQDFDNVYFELCNEGGAGDWKDHLIETITKTEAGLPNQHLIASDPTDNPKVSIFNIHYAKPRDVDNLYARGRAVAFDETGFQGGGDLPYRADAWDFLLAGGSVYDNLDWSFTVAKPDGTAPTQPNLGGGSPALREQLKVLADFLHAFNLLKMKPDQAILKGGLPQGTAARALVESGKQYAVFLRGGKQADLVLDLPAGTYKAEWVNTKTGAVAKSEPFTHGGGPKTLASPPYDADIALRVLAEK